MRRLVKIVYIVSMLACLGGIYLNWRLGESITWPAIALFWCMNAYLNEYKRYE